MSSALSETIKTLIACALVIGLAPANAQQDLTHGFQNLAGMLVAFILCAGKTLPAESPRLILLIRPALWFVLAPFWMRRKGWEDGRQK